MKQLRNLLPVMLLALLAWNCEDDEQQMPPNEGLHFLENKFSLEDFNDPFIKDNLKVNWDRYTKKSDSLSNTTVYEFETSAKGKLENDNKQFGYKYEVLGHNQGDAWDFEVVKILSNNAASVDNVSYFDLGNFSGTIHHYDLKGENTKSKAFEKGELVGEITGMEEKGPTAGSKEPPVSNEGVWVLITVKRYTDMYMYRGGGIYEYGYSVHNSTQHEWAFIGTGGTHSTYGHEQGDVYHGHHSGPSAPANPKDTHPYEEILTNEEIMNWENLIIGPDHPIANISEYLKCFELTQGAQLTIYIDQPITNDPAAWTTGSGKAGHTFISLSQNGIRRTWGLYPEGNASPFEVMDPYLFGNNQSNEFDVSISLTINKYALQNIVEDAANYYINYNLDSNNCTDYALQVAALAGLILPDPQSTWPGGGEGSNPGAFGQAIRNMSLPVGVTRNNNGGVSPSNSGNCN